MLYFAPKERAVRGVESSFMPLAMTRIGIGAFVTGLATVLSFASSAAFIPS